MKRMRLVGAIVAMLAMMALSSVPALADVKFDHDKYDDIEDKLDEHIDFLEDRYDIDIDDDEYYDYWWYGHDDKYFDIYDD